jgi:hypothetical protein
LGTVPAHFANWPSARGSSSDESGGDALYPAGRSDAFRFAAWASARASERLIADAVAATRQSSATAAARARDHFLICRL